MVITDIPGLPPTMPTELATTLIKPETFKYVHEHHLRFPKSNVILDNSFYDLEKVAIDAFRTEVLGTAGVEVCPISPTIEQYPYYCISCISTVIWNISFLSRLLNL